MKEIRRKIDKSKLEALRKQTEENYNRRNESFIFGGSIFREDLDIKQWICRSSDEPHLIDIIPYFASENHPNKKVKPGDLVYTAAFYVHKRVGANNLMFICPGYNYGEPCPICEERKRLIDELGYDDERVKSLRPTLQSLYNVIVYDSKEEEEKGIQVWMVPHFFMEKKLLDISKKPKGGGLIYYADPDEGKTISFYRKGKENVEFTGHQFIDRDYVITDEEIEKAYCLEDLIYRPTYEEIALAFYGRSNEKEKIKEEIMEEEDTSRIRKTSTIASSISSVKHEKKVLHCMAGGEFGIDIDKFEECAECESYDECAIEADRIEEEKKKQSSQSLPIRRRR